MPRLPIAELPVDTARLDVAKHDRRRLGRVTANPDLLPLLRGTAGIISRQAPKPDEAYAATSDADQSGDISHRAVPDNDYGDLKRSGLLVETGDGCFDDNEGHAARGVLFGLLLSVPLWGFVGGVVYWIFG